MKRLIFCVLAVCALAAASAPAPAAADSTGWPKTMEKNGYKLTAYQPQIDSWDNYSTLKGHYAVSLTGPNQKDPWYGTVAVTAKTVVDFDKRAVQISNVQLGAINFPLLNADQTKKLDDFVRANVNVQDTVLPLDTILLNMEQSKVQLRETKIGTDPPVIYYSEKPAILIAYDGDPIFSGIKELKDADLQFAVNTNWNVFKSGNAVYLLTGNGWLQSSSAQGPWQPSGALPAVMKQLPDTDNWKDVRSALNLGPVPQAKMPTIWVSTKPAEAIVVGGQPKLVAISGTQLSYVENTDSTLLFYKTDKRWYYFTSGRWFAAKSLSGPWVFANNTLPGDFKKIPASSQLGWVLPSVPGTPQAQQAIIEASVPREAWIDRQQAQLTVAYSGDPQFQPIQGTNLQYAVNTDVDVIKAGDMYYACKDAVWFKSSAPTGPWVVADSIPEEIYNIPSTSSAYSDTFVTVEESTTTSVLYGYSAGYGLGYWWGSGWYYGPGWYYPPYYGMWGGYPWYYPYPRTYVGGAFYNPATGGWGAGWGVRGPYGGATVGGGVTGGGAYWRGGSVYGPYGGIRGGAVYNPNTGNWYRGGVACGAGGCQRWGQGGNINNSATPYSNWGNAARQPNVNTPGQRPTTGNIGGNRPGGGNAAGAGPGVSNPIAGNRPGGGPGVSTNDNVFAGRDGNIYKPTGDGGWSQYNNQNRNWQNVNTSNLGGNRPTAGTQPSINRPTATQPTMNSNTYNNLNRSNYARSAGASNFGGMRGGGGFRGGRGR